MVDPDELGQRLTALGISDAPAGAALGHLAGGGCGMTDEGVSEPPDGAALGHLASGSRGAAHGVLREARRN